MSNLYEDPNNKKKGQSKQDVISRNTQLIKEKLQGCQQMSHQETENIPVGAWIKYLSYEGKYRSGGVVVANGFPEYLMCKNPSLNRSWSVNLRNNVIFLSKKTDLDKASKEVQREKDALYKLYQKGLLEMVEEN